MSGASPSSSLPTKCAEFQQLLQRYTEKYHQHGALCDPTLFRHSVRETKQLAADIEKMREEIAGAVLESRFGNFYAEQKDMQRDLRLLRPISPDGTEGIYTGWETYAFPTQLEILNRLKPREEIINKRLKQYRQPVLMIVPFACSIEELAHTWQQTLVRYKDMLHTLQGNAEVSARVRTDLSGNIFNSTTQPARVNEIFHSDDNFIYDPSTFGPEGVGKTKTQKNTELKGYSIILIDAIAQNTPYAKGDYLVPIPNLFAEEYRISGDPEESGAYAEELLCLHIYNLLKYNGRVTDAVNMEGNRGSGTYAIGMATKEGNFSAGNKRVPVLSFNIKGERGALQVQSADRKDPEFSGRKVIRM